REPELDAARDLAKPAAGAATDASVATASAPADVVDPNAESAAGAEASEVALAARSAFAALKESFGDGGREGWRSVGWNLEALEKALLGSEDGFAEFLAML